MDKKEQLIKDYSYLLWYIREDSKQNISDEFLVETMLNNGDWKGIERLMNLFGIKKVSDIFFKQISKRRTNYRKQTKHFFTLYFNKHVS